MGFAISLCLCSLVGGKGEEPVSRPLRSHANGEMKLALTFDDGPDGRYTDEILDVLGEYGVKATFFVIGKNCESSPDVLRRVVEEGHEVGNHTYSHPHLKGLSEEELEKQIKMTEQLVLNYTGIKTKLFRPPEGYYSNGIGVLCNSLGYRAVLWSVDTTDWRGPDAEEIAQTVISEARSGVIILCHDYVAKKSNTPAALRIFIPQLLEQGYEFVTVSELLEL